MTPQSPQVQPQTPSLEERQMAAMLRALNPAALDELNARHALQTVELDDDTLDALAVERVVEALRREAAARDGRSVAWMFTRLADRLARQASR